MVASTWQDSQHLKNGEKKERNESGKSRKHCGAIYGAMMSHRGMTSRVCSGLEYTWQDSQHCIGGEETRKVGSHDNTLVPSMGY